MNKETDLVINQRIGETELYVFSKDVSTGLFRYARPMFKEEAEPYRGKFIHPDIASMYARAKNGYLVGASVRSMSLANRGLMKKYSGRAWIPTIEEGIQLQKEKLLLPDVLTDLGVVVYAQESSEDKRPYEKDLEKHLMADIKRKGYEFPVLASYKAIEFKEQPRGHSLPEIVSTESLFTGKDAERMLNEFLHRGYRGAQRVYFSRKSGVVAGNDGPWSLSIKTSHRITCLNDEDEDFVAEYITRLGDGDELRADIEIEIEQRFSSEKRKHQEKVSSFQEQERQAADSADKVLTL